MEWNQFREVQSLILAQLDLGGRYISYHGMKFAFLEAKKISRNIHSDSWSV